MNISFLVKKINGRNTDDKGVQVSDVHVVIHQIHDNLLPTRRSSRNNLISNKFATNISTNTPIYLNISIVFSVFPILSSRLIILLYTLHSFNAKMSELYQTGKKI